MAFSPRLRGTSYLGSLSNRHFQPQRGCGPPVSIPVACCCRNDGLEANPRLGHPEQRYAAIPFRRLPSSGVLHQGRRPLLRDKPVRDALHSYLGGVSKQLDCPPLLVGGAEDHVHLLARSGRTLMQAEWVKELKRVSNLWLKERGPDYADFEWQGGCADFSVSHSNLEPVRQYIAGQEEHHRKIGFQDELRGCCAGTRWNGMGNMSGIDMARCEGIFRNRVAVDDLFVVYPR